MNRTKIQYLDHTWNPIKMRCTPVSAGCDNCWHLRAVDRMKHNPQQSYLDIDELHAPYYRHKTSTIGVQFMGDLFHEGIYGQYVWDVLSVMQNCQRHRFIVLTKRPENMQRLIAMYDQIGEPEPEPDYQVCNAKNIWFGVSVEDQKTADERIPILLDTPVQNRFGLSSSIMDPRKSTLAA